MNRYYAMYKCQLCGALLRYGEPHEIPYDKLPELLGMVIRRQHLASNPYLNTAPMQVPCKCKDGSAGMAYFAGFKKA